VKKLFEEAECSGLTGLHLDWFSSAGLRQEETVKVFQESLQAVDHDDKELVCELFGGLGSAYQEMGDYTSAEVNFK